MSRNYNPNVSEKINKSLNRREAVIKREKKILSIIFILIVSTIILLSSSIHAFAQMNNNKPLNKYYTSIEVSEGDTLWNIADQYIVSSNIDKKEYIEEICELNSLNNGQIHAGNHIVIAYYSNEEK